MKNTFFFLLTLLLSISAAHAQNRLLHDRGTFLISVGGEAGIYQNDITQTFGAVQETREDTAGAVFLPISAEFCITRFLSAGVMYQPGRYIEDNDSEENRVRFFGVHASIHLFKRMRNDFFIRANAGVGRLQINTEDTNFSQQTSWNGAQAGLTLGYRHSFGQHVGFYITAGRHAYNLNIREWTVNGANVDLNRFEFDMDLTGYQLSTGLFLRF
jgi:hypothetical protein